MLKIKSLVLQNIGRFTEPQTILFDSLGPLVQVDGVNANTGGSSGSGKSTIFNALDYLFGLNDIPNSLLQSRLTKGSISVAAVFDYNGRPLTITRSKKLTIDLDGEVTSGSSKITEEKLDQILGVSRPLFRSMLHKRQKEGGFFLALTPRETYDFLTDCLNLTDLRAKAEVAHEAASELATRLATKNAAVEAAKASSWATNNAIEALGPRPEGTADREALIALKAEAEKAHYLVENLKAGQAQELAELEKQKPTLEFGQFDDSRLQELTEQRSMFERAITQAERLEFERTSKIKDECQKKKAEYARIEQQKKAKLEGLNRTKLEGDVAKGRATQLAEEIRQLRENTCFTCHQTWNNEATKKKELELLSEMTRCKDLIQAGTDAGLAASLLASEIAADKTKSEADLKVIMDLADAVKLDRNIQVSGAQTSIAGIDKEIAIEKGKKDGYFGGIQARNKALTDEFAAKVAALRAEHLHMLQALVTESAAKRRALDLAVGGIKAQQEALERFDKTAASLAQQQEASMQKLMDVTAELLAINTRALMAEEAKRAIKAYTSRLFDTALQTISENATRIIRQIPNMANATIQLSATRETGDGKIKEEVNAVIHNDGEENIPLKTLSGGERTSADLAVDLAAIQFLEDQAGKGIDLFILDEPFTGLDSANIEAIVEMLKASSLTKRIVVVDHNPVIAESFESKIIVRRQGSSSSLSA
jgi:ABC-type lipoprotein export system ATPase subunit